MLNWLRWPPTSWLLSDAPLLVSELRHGCWDWPKTVSEFSVVCLVAFEAECTAEQLEKCTGPDGGIFVIDESFASTPRGRVGPQTVNWIHQTSISEQTATAARRLDVITWCRIEIELLNVDAYVSGLALELCVSSWIFLVVCYYKCQPQSVIILPRVDHHLALQLKQHQARHFEKPLSGNHHELHNIQLDLYDMLFHTLVWEDHLRQFWTWLAMVCTNFLGLEV